jgi:microcystin-dependent protein
MGFLSVQSIIPPGVTLPYSGTVVPTGWLTCDGSEVSRSTYAALYAALGGASSPYGQGNGSTTFNLPDLRGRVVAGKDSPVSGVYADRLTSTTVNSRTLGQPGGEQTHALLSSESGVPAHSHGITEPNSGQGHRHQTATTNGFGGEGGGANGGDFVPAVYSLYSTTGITINNNAAENASSAHNNVQPTIVLNYIVKA